MPGRWQSRASDFRQMSGLPWAASLVGGGQCGVLGRGMNQGPVSLSQPEVPNALFGRSTEYRVEGGATNGRSGWVSAAPILAWPLPPPLTVRLNNGEHSTGSGFQLQLTNALWLFCIH